MLLVACGQVKWVVLCITANRVLSPHPPLYFLKSSGRFANTSFCCSSFQTGQSAEGMSDTEERESIRKVYFSVVRHKAFSLGSASVQLKSALT